MLTTSDDLELLQAAYYSYLSKITEVRKYMVSFGVSYEPWIQKLDREQQATDQALKNVMHDWSEAKRKEYNVKKNELSHTS